MFPRSLSVLVLSITCAAALVAARPALARPSAWSAETMAAASTFFPAGTSAMVVGAGKDAQPVASTLLASLQASDRFEVVIDARALGKIDGLADAEIVARAFARPIQRVAIVRVFPASGSVKAVVTVYGAEGQVTTAFTLAPGRTLAPNPTPEVAEDGVRRDEMQTVQQTTSVGGITGTTSDDDEVRYERQHVVGVSHYGVINLENVNFFKNGRLISDTPSLYEALGMTDRANAYRRTAASYQRGLKRGGLLMGAGLLGVTVFGTWWLVRGVSSDYDAATDTYQDRDATMPMLLTAGSVAAMVIGGVIIRGTSKPVALTADEAVSLVDAHNAKKRRSVRATSPATSLYFAPSALPTGGGFVLGGSF